MGAGFPARQRVPVEVVQGQRDHALGDVVLGHDPDGGLELAGGQGEPGAAVLHRLDVGRRDQCGAYREVLLDRDDLDGLAGEAAHHLLGPALGGADDPDLGAVEGGHEFLDRHLGGQPRQRGAHAGVDALAEGEDLVLAGEGPEEVEGVGFGVDALVAVGRTHQHHDPGVRRNGDAGDGQLGGGLAAQVLRRTVVAQGLLDEVLHQRGVGAEVALQGGVLVQHRDAVGEQRGGCVGGRGQHQVGQPDHLRLLDRALLAGEQDLGDHVRGVRRSTRGDLLAAPAHDLGDVLLRLAVGAGGVLGDPELAHRARHRAHQVLLPERAVGGRRTHQPHRHTEHQRQRDVLGEVAAALLAQLGQQLANVPADVGLHGQDLPCRERRAHHVAQHGVVRLVLRHEVARAVGGVGSVHVVAQRVDHLLVVAQARADVLVPGHHPQVPARVVVDRRVVAQLPVHLVGVVVGRVGQRVVEHRQPVRQLGAGRRGRRRGEGHRRPHIQRFRESGSGLVASRCCHPGVERSINDRALHRRASTALS